MFDLPPPRTDWAVLDWNRSAIDFHESLGAAPMDGWTGYRLSGEALAVLGSTDQPPDWAVPTGGGSSAEFVGGPLPVMGNSQGIGFEVPAREEELTQGGARP